MNLMNDMEKEVHSVLRGIELQLRNRESFGGVSAKNCNAGIMLNGYLTVVPSYIYVSMEVSEKELRSPDEVADRFVLEWTKNDNPKDIRMFQQFIMNGERWGWD